MLWIYTLKDENDQFMKYTQPYLCFPKKSPIGINDIIVIYAKNIGITCIVSCESKIEKNDSHKVFCNLNSNKFVIKINKLYCGEIINIEKIVTENILKELKLKDMKAFYNKYVKDVFVIKKLEIIMENIKPYITIQKIGEKKFNYTKEFYRKFLNITPGVLKFFD